jgi:hypothetical protein
MRLVVDEYTDCTKGSRDRTLFQVSPGGESLLLLADGSETAFAHGYQPLIDLVKTVFARSLFVGAGPMQERMLRATRAVVSAMSEGFISSEEFGEASYSAVFVALVIVEQCAFPVWIGSPQASMFRNGCCVKKTSSHVTVLPASAGSGLIVTRQALSTVPNHADSHVEVGEPWRLAQDDVLVLADHRLFALSPDSEMVDIISNPVTPAKNLVEWAQRFRYRFAEAALVLRVC